MSVQCLEPEDGLPEQRVCVFFNLAMYEGKLYYISSGEGPLPAEALAAAAAADGLCRSGARGGVVQERSGGCAGAGWEGVRAVQERRGVGVAHRDFPQSHPRATREPPRRPATDSNVTLPSIKHAWLKKFEGDDYFSATVVNQSALPFDWNGTQVSRSRRRGCSGGSMERKPDAGKRGPAKPGRGALHSSRRAEHGARRPASPAPTRSQQQQVEFVSTAGLFHQQHYSNFYHMFSEVAPTIHHVICKYLGDCGYDPQSRCAGMLAAQGRGESGLGLTAAWRHLPIGGTSRRGERQPPLACTSRCSA